MEIKLNASKVKWKVNTKELIKNIFDFNWGTAITDVVEIKKDEEAIAFLLLFNTTRKTIYELLKKYGQEKLNQVNNLVSSNRLLEIELKEFFENDIVINKDFFFNVVQYNPKYLTKSFTIFKKFADELNIILPSDIHYDYYELFRITLNNEYQENKEQYLKLVQFFENPVYEETLKQTFLFEHYKFISSFYTSRLQSEIETANETLHDLYIEPNFVVFKKNIIRSVPENLNFESISEDSLHKFISNYFFKNIKHPELKSSYKMLFLLGQPGQGKTSFSYKQVHDYITSSLGLPEAPIFFVKIRDLVAKDFIESPFEILYKKFHSNFNFEKENGILILDGLDEAYMSGGISDSDLRNLYDRLNKGGSENLKIILTSRKNYINLNDSCVDNSLVIELTDFTNEQVIAYKNKFLTFYPNNKFIKKLDVFINEKKKEKYKHVQELIRQPVIIYFIALANIDVEKLNSKAEIYGKIFSSLSERSWDKQKGQLDFINKNLDKQKYQHLLRDFIRHIAFEIYQSPKLYITLSKLSSLDATKMFVKKCFEESFVADEGNFKKVTKYLLISFYFQESKNSLSETAVEFFHNSLWEYLTAEYIWEKFKDLFLAKDRFGEFIIIDVKEYFDFVDKIIGIKELSYQVQLNLEDIITNEDVSILRSLKNQANKVFYKLSDNDFLLFYNYEVNILSSNLKAFEIFDLSFTIQNTINKSLKEITELNENFLKFFAIKYYKYTQISGVIENVNSSLKIPLPNGYDINFKNSRIEGMYNQELSDCNFDNIIIFEGQIRNCTFEECNFRNTHFIDVGVIKTIFKKNEFFNSKFQFVRFASLEDYDSFRSENTFNYDFEELHTVEVHRDKSCVIMLKEFSFNEIKENFYKILNESDILINRDSFKY
jgi:hypothetical protein